MWSHPKIAERYEIVEALGEGKRSRVIRARSRNVPRDFAIKIFSFDHGEKGERSRIRARREAEALSKLSHPHLVNLFEVLELDDRNLALVMDFIDGTRLDWRIAQEGVMSPREVLTLGRQLAMALNEAHSNALVHRDVQPRNVFVRGLASGDLFAHLFDFGIVRGPAPSTLTQGFVGTPEFASPEQVRGAEIDVRTDIFGLGATLFFALTEHPPYPDTSLDDLEARVDEPPPRASFYVDVPEALDDLLTRMMALDPDDRPPRMKDVIRILRSLDFGESPSLAEGTATEDPPVLLMPAEPSSATEASEGWEAERVTQLIVGPHVVATRGSAVGFLDQELDLHVVEPLRGRRHEMKTTLRVPPRSLALWSEGAVALLDNRAVARWSWDGAEDVVRRSDPDVSTIACFGDGRVILGLKSGECLVEQPNGSWKGHRAGRTPVNALAATRSAVALSTKDGAMLVNPTSFDVPLRHLGLSVDHFAFSDDGYLLGLAREGRFEVVNVENRGKLMEGNLPAKTLHISFHETDLCAYMVDGGRLLRFRLL